MKIKSEDLLNIKLPRWEEFPNFELYIDQVIAFINEKLDVFNPNPSEALITASMINNYVKNGVLPAPVKKKYNREHLGKLVVICIGKRMLSLTDINDSIIVMSKVLDIGEGYNMFCDELEYEIYSSVCPDKFPPHTIVSATTREVATIRALTSAVAKILVFDKIIGQRRRLSGLVSKMK